jgi:hypothetical protein
MSMPSVRVQIVQPIAGSDESAALDMNFEVTPGHWTGATVTQKTARCLIQGLQVALDEIEADQVRSRLADPDEHK